MCTVQYYSLMLGEKKCDSERLLQEDDHISGTALSSPTSTQGGQSKTVPGATGTCTTCGPYTEENIRVHMKTAWHTFNIQRKCGGESVMTLQDYEEVSE